MAALYGVLFAGGCGPGPGQRRAGERTGDPPTRLCYASADGRLVRSTLVSMRVDDGEQLASVTELGSGARVAEQVTIDRAGRLVHATASLGAGAGGSAGRPATRVTLEPGRGTVTVTTATLRAEWTVPTDLPWAWAPLLTEPSSGAPIATPLDARVVLMAAAGGRPVRLLDLGALQSHTVTADQLVVADGDATVVILGNDAVDVAGGMPQRLHLDALGADLEPFGARDTVGALATAMGCLPLGGPLTP